MTRKFARSEGHEVTILNVSITINEKDQTHQVVDISELSKFSRWRRDSF